MAYIPVAQRKTKTLSAQEVEQEALRRAVGFQKTLTPLPASKQTLGQKISNYVAPQIDRVRAVDILRELPGAILQTSQEIGRSIANIPARLALTATEKVTGKPVTVIPTGTIQKVLLGKKLVESYQQELRSRADDFLVMGFSPNASAALAFTEVGSGSILDATILGGIVESGVKGFLAGTKVPTVKHQSAWEFLGKPKTPKEAKITAHNLLRNVSPLSSNAQAAGTVNETATKAITNAYTILKVNGIPKQPGIIAKATEKLVTPISKLFTLKDGTLPATVTGLLPERAGTIPARAFQPIRQPAMGLSIREVPSKSIIPSELESLAQEARKYKSADDFIQSIRLKAIEKNPKDAIELKNIRAELAKLPENKMASEAVTLLHKYKSGGWFSAAEDFYKEATQEIGKIATTIPKELESLAVEARKYKSAEEFVKKQTGIRNLASAEGYANRNVINQLTDFWKQANQLEIKIINEPAIIKISPSSINKLISPPPAKITKTEDVLLRGRIRSEARGAKQAVVQYKRQTSFLETLSNKITQELNKPKGRERSTIAFVKELGDFNQTVVNEIKSELGITRPIKEMNLVELGDFVGKLKERLRFKYEKGYQPSVETREKLNLKESPKQQLNEVDYEKNRQLRKEIKPTIKKEVIKLGENIKGGTSKILAPISTRLENIDPSLKYALRKFEFDRNMAIQNDTKLTNPYLKKTKKLADEDFADLDLALKNSDSTKINEINKKYGLEKEYNNVREILDDIYKRANQVGFDIGYQKNYWPRVIKDTEGFLEYFGKQEYWSIIDEAVKGKELQLGRYLTQEEKANLINTMIRGYSGGQITLSGTGSMEGRVIDVVTPELNKFYYDYPSSLVRYIEEVEDKIGARKFFGKSNKVEGYNNIEDSVGAYTADLIAKEKITPKQELELRNILTARFNPKGTHGLIGIYKNLAYVDVMGSFLNAVTQLGDQAWAIYRGGFWGALKADIKAIGGKSLITKESIGIEANRIAQEFSESGKTAKLVDTVFKLTGLTKIDRLGKEALVNSAISKYQKLANNPTTDFLKMIDDIFGKESEAVLADLRSGQITENVKLLAFNELLDFHPVALSEMPEAYLRGANGRIFYMLKSYTLKQFDVFRREAFREMNKGNWLKGFKNLFYLAGLIILANGTADTIKDLLTGRKTELPDLLVDQIAVLAGFSRYTLNRVSEEGLGSAALEQILPPTNLIDNISKDLIALYKDFDKSADINKLRTVQDIPLVGKFYYWWFGKGKKAEKSETGSDLPQLPTLPKLPSLPSLPKL